MNAQELSSINRANAAHSTGPRTTEGKQRAAMNALKHGLTGQQLILQPEEHDAYRRLSKSLRSELRPRTEMEHQFVQKIIDTHMRLNRVAALDNNMLNFGLLENLADADQKADEDNETAIAHAQAKSWIAQQMSFDKLGRYEGRLSRQLLAYTKELERLQTNRAEKERKDKERDRERAFIPERSLASRTSRFSAVRVANHGIGITRQDLPQQNSSASQDDCSSASFGSEGHASDSQHLDSLAPEPIPAAA